METIVAPFAAPTFRPSEFFISHETDVSVARRAALSLAAELGFDETAAGAVAIVVTEIATNILKHAALGRMLITASSGHEKAIDLIGMDRGPGMNDVSASRHDGVSTAGTYGDGLGAIDRLSAFSEIYSQPGKSTCIYARVTAEAGCAHEKSAVASMSRIAPAASHGRDTGSDSVQPVLENRLEYYAIAVPISGEDACGDVWHVQPADRRAVVVMADGLGHGPDAAEAARRAVDVMTMRAELPPDRLLELAHQAARGTRGAAVAVACVDFERQVLDFAGVGNIAGCVIDGDIRKHLLSHNGIVGHAMRTVRKFSQPFPLGALCILHSDGVGTHWNLSDYPQLSSCHPALIAAVLYRDHARGRDDAAILVARRLA